MEKISFFLLILPVWLDIGKSIEISTDVTHVDEHGELESISDGVTVLDHIRDLFNCRIHAE